MCFFSPPLLREERNVLASEVDQTEVGELSAEQMRWVISKTWGDFAQFLLDDASM